MTDLNISCIDEQNVILKDEENSHQCSYVLKEEIAVSLEQACILHICGQQSTGRTAIALSDYSVEVFDIESLKKISSFNEHLGRISDIKFGKKNDELVYSASIDGTIKVHDLRSHKSVFTLRDDTEGPTNLKPLTCFDFSLDEKFASAGTDLVDGDAFILFWDIRSTKLLGGYWESHTDDVTQVRFHPEEKNTLMTASTDGLINIFDIRKENEDDALLYSLNTESSVDKLTWYKGQNKTFKISCITDTEDLQLWAIDDAAPFAHFSRADVAEVLKEKSSADDTYIANAHCTGDDGLLVLAGMSGKGNCSLQVLSVNEATLCPVSILNGNKQVVRSSWYDDLNGILLTGGEGGFLSLWKSQQIGTLDNIDSRLKMVKVRQKNKMRPY